MLHQRDVGWKILMKTKEWGGEIESGWEIEFVYEENVELFQIVYH